ncbi:MAG TPA: chemotaxis protein CheW [Anaeromyxobacteraceae bacterium]|nr:chemotaxis protein CheW [Anaeromyxobacteraceae bacterium]
MSDVHELVLFQLGARVFAARAADVRRIAGPLVEHEDEAVGETALGRPWDPRRGLVVKASGNERTLLVDGVLGLKAVPESDFQPLPRFVSDVLPTGALAGFAMLDEVPTLVVDLPTLVREGEPGAAGPREETRHA